MPATTPATIGMMSGPVGHSVKSKGKSEPTRDDIGKVRPKLQRPHLSRIQNI